MFPFKTLKKVFYIMIMMLIRTKNCMQTKIWHCLPLSFICFPKCSGNLCKLGVDPRFSNGTNLRFSDLYTICFPRHISQRCTRQILQCKVGTGFSQRQRTTSWGQCSGSTFENHWYQLFSWKKKIRYYFRSFFF